MEKITVEYKPYRWLNRRRTVTGNFPSSWSELSPDQLITLAKANDDQVSNTEFLHTFTGISKRVIRKLDNYHQFKLIELVGFVNTIGPHFKFIIPFVETNKMVFCSPKTLLKDMTFGQFIFADSFFRNYNETNKKDELNRFVASLYLPQGKVFKEKYIHNHIMDMDAVSTHIKQAIRLNYVLIFEWLMDSYPMVFPRQLPDETTRDKPRDPKSWVKIFDSLVGDDIVNQDKYAALPVHTVFRFFTKNIKESMKSKSKKLIH